jgi:hypothetical protein
VLCIALAGVLAWVVVPSQKRVPTDYKPPDVVVEAAGATFVAVSMSGGLPQVSSQKGTLRSATVVTPDPKAAAGLKDSLVWGVSQTTTSVEAGAPISQSDSRIALDQVSGAAVPWNGQCYHEAQTGAACTPGNVAFAGQLYLFPFDTGKKTYQYWDGTLRAALPIAFRGEEKVAGLDTYRFEQVVPRQDLPVDAMTLAVLAPGARSGKMFYEGSRTLWVEPMTGAIVAYQDKQHRELTPDTGAPVVLIDAAFTYDPATSKTVVDEAKDGRSQLLMLGRRLPLGLLIAGALMALAGLFFVTRRRVLTPAR